MTRQLANRESKRGKVQRCARTSALDPRLVELVKYLARRAAERDYEIIQNASLNDTTLSGTTDPDDAGADS